VAGSLVVGGGDVSVAGPSTDDADAVDRAVVVPAVDADEHAPAAIVSSTVAPTVRNMHRGGLRFDRHVIAWTVGGGASPAHGSAVELYEN
jgi:hypothetical protein